MSNLSIHTIKRNKKMKKILFLEENFSMQGTTRALIDYAYYNQKYLNNISYLAFGKKQDNEPWNTLYYKNILDNTFESLKLKFNLLYYKDYNELENHIIKEQFDGMYHIKSGEPIGFHSKNTKNLVHAVFPQPIQNIHGEKYAYVSKWLSDNYGYSKIPHVPHMINVPKIDINSSKIRIRQKYNIPNDAFVFGRIGGYNDFNLPFVYDAINDALNTRKNLYFIFICTKPFISHKRVLFIDPIYDIKEKYAHISACDAMIHARHHGETFGLAIAEFCSMNKPIVTWKFGAGQGYIDILKKDAIYYRNQNELFDILNNFEVEKDKNYNSYEEFSPKNVMSKFETVFLNNL
jgi:hypothetical protein